MAGGHRRTGSASQHLTERELRQLLFLGVLGLGIIDAAQGVGYLFGSPATAPSLQLMAGFAPMWVWGLSLTIAGLALMLGFYLTGFIIGGFISTIWAAFSFAVVINGTATGWSWPWPLGYAVVHFAAAWIRGQLKTRARGR